MLALRRGTPFGEEGTWPFEQLTNLHHEMDRVVGHHWGETPGMGKMMKSGHGFAPAAEVISDENAWHLRMALPGIGLSWNIKGFAFLNTDFTLYIDDSVGILGPGGDPNGAPSEDDSYMFDVNWARPIGKKASIEGHAEYIGERTNEFGNKVEAWILAQPQFRYYVNPSVAIGIEYQYWMNKLGDDATDESAVQLLLVWKF